jgi:hypothetical protein
MMVILAATRDIGLESSASDMSPPQPKVPRSDRALIDAVVAVLSRTDAPMTARELVSAMQLRGCSVEKSELNKALYRHLNSDNPQLVHDQVAFSWTLAPKDHGSSTGIARVSTSPNRSGEAEDGERRHATDTALVGSANNEPIFAAHVLAASPTVAEPLQVWTSAQQALIKLRPDARALVIAPPGTGKTAVACARIAYLLQEHKLLQSSVLMFSFTRAAVAEARERIASAASDATILGGVEITTLDSSAWQLDRAFGEHNRTEQLFKSFDDGIEATLELVRKRGGDVEEFLGHIRHLIVDEAQDLVGPRAALVFEIINALPKSCGVTVFADPAQAIYGFARDDDDGPEKEDEFVDAMRTRLPDFQRFELDQLHRTKDPRLVQLFKQARACVEPDRTASPRRVAAPLEQVTEVVGSQASPVEGWTQDWDLTDDHLILFRQRAQVLQQSSFLSSQATGHRKVHRLRLSGYPQPIQPWVAMLFAGFEDSRLSREEFDIRWTGGLSNLYGSLKESAWQLLFRYARSKRSLAIDVPLLRGILSRDRPPIDFCSPDAGARGPILGTIHASKGRQANHVIMLLPRHKAGLGEDRAAAEARVIYVGATRARQSLQVGDGVRAYFSKSQRGRMFRVNKGLLVFEVGLEGDFVLHSPVDTRHVPDEGRAQANQQLFARGLSYASCAARLVKSDADTGYEYQVFLETREGRAPLGALASSLYWDLKDIHKRVGGRFLAPNFISHLVVYGVRSVVLSPDSLHLSRLHRSFQNSGFFLAPLIKAFTCTPFTKRA